MPVADRYRRLIAPLVADPPPFAATVEGPGVVQVERATVLADALAGRPVGPPAADDADVADAAGHRRPVYRPLLAYARLTAAVVRGGPPHAVTMWPDPAVAFTAANGGAASAAVWSALAMHLSHVADARQTWPRMAAYVFTRLVEGQQANGSFLRTTPADNPETHWFHELVTLHAAADYAWLTGDPAVAAAVSRAAHYHLNETETDHATGQPWGLPAFVRDDAVSPVADAMLHAVSAHQPAGPTGVALFLLADTLYGLARPSLMENRP